MKQAGALQHRSSIEPREQTEWHQRSAEETLALLRTTRTGLTHDEAAHCLY